MRIGLEYKKVYVLHVQTGEEKYVASMLKRQGYKTMTPSCIRLQRKGGKWNLVERLLFTSYVFVALDEELTDIDYYKINKVPNLIKILKMGSAFEYLTPDEVAFIELLHNNGAALPILNADKLEDVKALGGELTELELRKKKCKIVFEFMGKRKELILSIE